jgi:hypothetical protein
MRPTEREALPKTIVIASRESGGEELTPRAAPAVNFSISRRTVVPSPLHPSFHCFPKLLLSIIATIRVMTPAPPSQRRSRCRTSDCSHESPSADTDVDGAHSCFRDAATRLKLPPIAWLYVFWSRAVSSNGGSLNSAEERKAPDAAMSPHQGRKPHSL